MYLGAIGAVSTIPCMVFLLNLSLMNWHTFKMKIPLNTVLLCLPMNHDFSKYSTRLPKNHHGISRYSKIGVGALPFINLSERLSLKLWKSKSSKVKYISKGWYAWQMPVSPCIEMPLSPKWRVVSFMDSRLLCMAKSRSKMVR